MKAPTLAGSQPLSKTTVDRQLFGKASGLFYATYHRLSLSYIVVAKMVPSSATGHPVETAMRWTVEHRLAISIERRRH